MVEVALRALDHLRARVSDGTPSEIVPLLDADLNPINREDDHA
jgi:hypothetical protein